MAATAVRDASGMIIGYTQDDGTFVPATEPKTTAKSFLDVSTDDPLAFGDYSANDIKRLEGQGATRAAVVGGIGALGDAAKLGLMFLPTAADKLNEKRLSELEKDKGLSQARRAEIDEQAMRGVRALGRETSARMGDQLASSGGHSAASLQRARASSQDALSRAAIQAADIGIREDVAQEQRDVIEQNERVAYEAGRENARLSYAGKAIGDLFGAAAKPIAAAAFSAAPTDAQLVKMQTAIDPQTGALLYPGLQGKSLEQMRATPSSQWKLIDPRLAGNETPIP